MKFEFTIKDLEVETFNRVSLGRIKNNLLNMQANVSVSMTTQLLGLMIASVSIRWYFAF